jgi:hypothetical protein
MSLVGLRSAVVASLGTNVPAFHTAQAHGGRFNRGEITRLALQSPGVFVAVMGGPITREGGSVVCAAELVAYVITGGTSIEKRDEAALVLAEEVARQVANNAWAYTGSRAPSNISTANLYSGDVDKLGVALWSVAWTQLIDLITEDDTLTLDDFERLYVDYDLAPKDETIDAQDIVTLEGELMSAYGHINIATPVATTIAVANTYQKAAGTTALNLAHDCDMPVTGQVRNSGTVTKVFAVDASLSAIVSADAKVTVAIAKNGTVDEDTAIEQAVSLTEGAEAFALTHIVSLAHDDYVEVWVKADALVNVTLTKMSLKISAS